MKSDYAKPLDKCILNPTKCDNGLAYSIWEKVSYKEDILNVKKWHERKYVLSTGGDYNYTTGKIYPGIAIYHKGMDLFAVLATNEDVWELRVRGQLVNESWSNIGINWEKFKEADGLHHSERGGLEVCKPTISSLLNGQSYFLDKNIP